MTEPWIGDESQGTPGTCLFAAEPGQPKCGESATVHLMSESAIYGAVSLATCDRHAPLARAAGPLLAEHPFADGCLPHETWFRLDGCVSEEERHDCLRAMPPLHQVGP